MRKVKYLLKIGLVFFLFSYTSFVYSQSQGPVAPEAASFEPIDATDMVNLSTGSLTYVLPIINVPSPEGGYPLAIAYHASIAMDQESTWTGLGWNLNAGAINRSVNGYPDDYNSALINEYFYDEGGQETVYSLSLGYTNGAISTGLGLSWGSNRSLGGFVSVGFGANIEGFGRLGGGVRIGTDGVGINVGATLKGGMTLGVSASSNGGINSSVGYDNNGSGFSISTNGSVSIDLIQGTKNDNQVGIGLTLSSSGISVDAKITNKTGNNVNGGIGAGFQSQFENTVQMGEYTLRSSGWSIPLVAPTPIGTFSLTFGKQKYRYALGKNENDYVTGPIFYHQSVSNKIVYKVTCKGLDYYDEPISCGSYTTDIEQEAINFKNQTEASSNTPDCQCIISEIDSGDSFMDIYEVPLNGNSLSKSSKIESNNPSFPSYDRYNVQAQGLSGGMSSIVYDNGALFGLTGRENKDEYSLKYAIDGSSPSIPNHARFLQKPNFYFDNEISSYFNKTDVGKSLFTNLNQSKILDYFSSFEAGESGNSKSRRRNSTYIEYFRNAEILTNYLGVKSKGYLSPSGTGFDRTNKPKDGIGAFKITSIDGKTYHYSLPVYNHETVTRTFGLIDDRPNENQSYFEKRQLEPYATHWLLTAVTGPDYFDANDNGKADIGDYGYWVEFDYGKWSDAFIWKSPFGKDYLDNIENPDIKTKIIGRKEVYYLDRVKTRSHTALFLKSERQDGHSQYWNYKSVEHRDNKIQSSAAFQSRFIVPSQSPLKLNKIILVKNVNDNVNKSSGSSNEGFVDIKYNNSEKLLERAYYNSKDNVLDIGDNWSGLLIHASKVIDFNYETPLNSLVKGSPNTSNIDYGRLTLKSVDFKGKHGNSIIPHYKFFYNNNNSYIFDIEDKDGFGYKVNDNALWSLNKIQTPQGGEIQINYESHKFKTVIDSEIKFRRFNSDFIITPDYDGGNPNNGDQPRAFYVESSEDVGIQIGDRLKINYNYTAYIHQGYGANGYDGHEEVSCAFNGYGTITHDLNNNKFFLLPDQGGFICESYNGNNNPTQWNEDYFDLDFSATYIVTNPIEAGGIRVSDIITTDGSQTYTTSYNYGQNNDGFGYISYLPFAPELQEELPYSSELPPPGVMYEYVSMQTKNTNNQSDGKTEYKFKILKEKDANTIKFGDLYEIEVVSNNYNNTSENKNVNISTYTIKDNLATLGSLLEVSTYNSEGHLLSKIENEYYSPEQTPNKLGVTQESYQTYKTIDYIDTNKQDKWLINSSTRVKYPSLLKESTEITNNNQHSTQFGNLDLITGKPRELYSYSSDGIKLKTKTVFAFDEYQGMGSKVDNVDNSNMLSQETANFVYLIDPITGNDKIVGANISTWNNDWLYRDQTGVEFSPMNNKAKIWRKHKTYSWKGELDSDGAYVNYNQLNNDNFDWGIGANQTDENWQKISEIKRYNHYSSALEVEDINKNLASSKKGDKQSKVLATSNAAYTEIYYSGAEYLSENNSSYFDGEIKANYREFGTFHTGNYSVKVSNNQQGFYTTLKSNEHRALKYKISVWAKKGNHINARVYDGNSLQEFNGEKTLAGNWILLNHYVDLSSGTKNIYVTSQSGDIFYDDFRIHPVSSSMQSFVYNKFDEVTYMTGANGLSTYYIYDDAGRLKETWVEVIDNTQTGITGGFKRINENKYNYKNN
tara:strand:+ start:40798 stop:45828 length:5031 start_codon:yes stop_codon:yes gene_type:complete